jgi:hypothetical protein
MSYKNFWSLNIDEVVVTGELRKELRKSLKKDIEIMMPMNAQLKDIDLLAINLTNRKVLTIQVKGSRAYEPNQKARRDFGKGSGGWFFLEKSIIERCSADYFIFLIYIINENQEKGKLSLDKHTITISPKTLFDKCEKHKILKGNKYSFQIWINPETKEAFDFTDERKKGRLDLTNYLDVKGFEQIRQDLI